VKQASRQGAARARRVVLGTALGARCLYASVAGSLWCVTGGLGKGLPAQVCRPEVTDTPEAPRAAKAKLAEMGGMSRDERIMLGTMLGGAPRGARAPVYRRSRSTGMALWGAPAAMAAVLGVCVPLGSGMLNSVLRMAPHASKSAAAAWLAASSLRSCAKLSGALQLSAAGANSHQRCGLLGLAGRRSASRCRAHTMHTMLGTGHLT